MLKVYCVIFLSFTFLSLYSVPPFSGSMFRPFFLSPFKYSTRKTQWGQSARVTEIQLNLLREVTDMAITLRVIPFPSGENAISLLHQI